MIVGFALAFLLLLIRYGYGWAMAARGWLYDQGIFSSAAFDLPVIALGNLRVGGTGKSPHAAYVVGLLLGAGYRVALLSRGYGRRTRGFQLVTPSDSAETVGDEPLEQVRRFQAEIGQGLLTVAVAEARAAGIRALLAGPNPPEVVVLDDAYQHRAGRPSLRLLLAEFHRPFPADRILPLGRLREFAHEARRADAVIVSKCSPAEPRPELVRGLNLQAIRQAAGAETPVFFTAYDYAPWQPVEAPTGRGDIGAFAAPQPPSSVVLLTAIDNPAPLLDHLLGRGFTIARHLRFADHHDFTAADLAAVRAAATAGGCPIVTTGKDAVRLLTPAGQLRSELAALSVWWVPVAVREVPAAERVEPANLRALVLDHVRGFTTPFLARPLAVAALLGSLLVSGIAPLSAQAQTIPTPPPAGQAPGQPPADDPATAKPKKPRRILNDSVKTRYGPRTTRVYYERDVVNGQRRSYVLDTAFHEFWNQRRWYHDSATFQQDLGNVGSAARPQLWPVGQPQTGIRWGRRAFDRYAYDLPTIPYYDTRSPFSRIAYVQGARGEQVFEARYTRNIRQVFNFGASYQRLSANKQFATTQLKDNYLTHAAASAWAAYATPDSTWRVLASYAHMSHEVVEQGSVLGDPAAFDLYSNVPVALAFARNREYRNAWRLTQLVRLVGPGLQLFYTFDRRVQQNRFSDYNSQMRPAEKLAELRAFPHVYLDSTRTQDDARFRLNQH
ncbi:MAG: tetraacyldisaccharide 4'-kinase, partial [Hymenobacteraceae bacterium]|nr:tetraacyldisaccharide 4'-kinase [Hymenobacteraceae bacterium]